jgi:hypothetical protein
MSEDTANLKRKVVKAQASVRRMISWCETADRMEDQDIAKACMFVDDALSMLLCAETALSVDHK